jgi:hypothetical protein
MVEHLKVMAALTVEPAYASSPSPLLISRAPSPLPLLISRADGGLISRACYAPWRTLWSSTLKGRSHSLFIWWGFELSLIFLTSFGGPISIKEAHSTVQERDGVTHYSYGEGPLPLLSLMVEHPKGSLIVEYLKVLSLSVEPAYASYGRAPPVLSLWSSLLTHPY